MGSLFGYEVVEAGLPLRRLRPDPGPRGRLVVRAGERLLETDGDLTAYDDTAGSLLALARAGDRVLMWCEVAGAFALHPGAGLVEAEPRGAPGDAWEHRLVATAVPLLLAERGDVVLHAGAVDAGGRAVVFLGPSRRGKSTLALALTRAGLPLIAEDGVALSAGDPPLVWPGPLGVRLKRAHADGGRRVELHFPEAEAPAAVPLGALVVLEPRGTALRVERIDPADAVPALLAGLFHAGGVDALRPAFSRLAPVAGRARVFSASLPDDLEALDDAAARLLAAVSPGAAPRAARP
jgi:hypothetical protein